MDFPPELQFPFDPVPEDEQEIEFVEEAPGQFYARATGRRVPRVATPPPPTPPPMPPTKSRSNTVDEDDNLMCRVCRSTEGDLYYPCLCTGSIKYVHQECLTEWLKYSNKEVCELCNHKYSFQPIYRSDMPKALPILEIMKGIWVNCFRMLKVWLRYTMVLFAWLFLVPLIAARIYNAVFYSSIQEFMTIPMLFFKMEHMGMDIFKGTFLLFIFVCIFISLVWLREQIIHGGPQDFLNIEDLPVQAAPAAAAQPAAAPAQPQRQPRRRSPGAERADRQALGVPGGEANENAGNAQQYLPEWNRGLQGNDGQDHPLLGDSDDDESSDDDSELADEELRAINEAPVGRAVRGLDDAELEAHLAAVERARVQREQMLRESDDDDNDEDEEGGGEGDGEAHEEGQPEAAQEDNWRDWDRLGDELTWQRLLGLDGSYVFLEHVFWVISLNTLFTVVFAYTPYKLGFWILSKIGIQQKIIYFPSIAAMLSGYVAFSICIYLIHSLVGYFKIKALYRLFGICFLELKVFLLVLVEIGFFPIMCGCWMDLCSLSLFSASLSSRIAVFASSPTSSVFIHWMIGMVYVFYSASFVLLLREVLRPGVLWFMRNLNDPEFNPIQEMVELPVSRHLRRLVASTSLFFSTIFLIVYLPLRIVAKLAPTVLPYNMSLSADTPLSELSLELLILQVVLPALLEQTQARTLLKAFIGWWCKHIGGFLKLDRYLLPDQPIDRREGDAQPPPPAFAPAGGLAAEHQALLLMREPLAFQPYVRPNWFPLRIVALLMAMATTWCITSCGLFLIPVTVGRFIVNRLWGHSNVHELYTVGFGLYVCWMVVKLGILGFDWFQRGIEQIKAAAVDASKLFARLLFICTPVVFLIPMLMGQYFQLVVIAPMRLGVAQRALFFPWQDWAMGVLHMKIFCATVMMGPDWWLKVIFEQIYQDGLRNMRVKFILINFVLPISLFLANLIAIPYVIARFYLFVSNSSYDDRNYVYRHCYPFSLCIVIIVSFCYWQFKKIRGLAAKIRDEKYLMGTQLVNYER